MRTNTLKSILLVRMPPAFWFGWLFVALWMGLIFFASTDLFSAKHTSRFVEPFLRWMFHGRLSEPEVQQIHFLIRKLGHLSEYAVLALLTRNAIHRTVSLDVTPGTRPGEWTISGLALLVAAIYAAGDEFHQSFVPSRSASVRDVMIDSAGATLGLLILHGIRRLRPCWDGRYRRPDKS